MSARLIKIAIIACILFTGLNAYASPITTDSFMTGDPFHFAFVTSGTTDATSADINYYNQFVQDAADAAAAGIGVQLGLTWRAFISTPTQHATDNVDIQGRVITLSDDIVAYNPADLYDASIHNPINYNELGIYENTNVWTGSASNGFGYPANEVGNPDRGAVYGNTTNIDFRWVSTNTAVKNESFHLYAFSNLVIYDDGAFHAVPIPPSILLMASGLIGCVGFKRWFRR